MVAKKYTSLGFIALLILSTALVFKFGSRIDLFTSKSPEYYTALLEPKANSPLSLIDEKTKKVAEEMQSIFGGEKSIQWMSVQLDFQEARILIRVKTLCFKKNSNPKTFLIN